jgi:hypothetical protein
MISSSQIEPDVGGLQRLVEHVEAGGAHVILHDRDLVLSFGERALASAVPASLLFSYALVLPAEAENR